MRMCLFVFSLFNFNFLFFSLSTREEHPAQKWECCLSLLLFLLVSCYKGVATPPPPPLPPHLHFWNPGAAILTSNDKRMQLWIKTFYWSGVLYILTKGSMPLNLHKTMVLQIKTYEPKISNLGSKSFHVRGQKEKQIFFFAKKLIPQSCFLLSLDGSIAWNNSTWPKKMSRLTSIAKLIEEVFELIPVCSILLNIWNSLPWDESPGKKGECVVDWPHHRLTVLMRC